MERYHIYKLGFAILFYAVYHRKPSTVYGLSTHQQESSTDELVFYQGVQGKPGVDFPIFHRIPRTSFNCKEVESGYYADVETNCQVFHICNDGAKISFLCPNGTIFQQSDLICEWWFKVNCTNSPSLYEESAEQLREQEFRRKSLRKVTNDVQNKRRPIYDDNQRETINFDQVTASNVRRKSGIEDKPMRTYKEKEIIRIKQISSRVDRTRSNGEERSLNGEERRLRGEERRLNGEKRRLNGEVRSPNGEERGLNGEARSPNGEERGLNGEVRSPNDEERRLSDEKRRLSVEERHLDGGTKQLNDEKRRVDGAIGSLEQSSSEETQIFEETASYYKNNQNSIHQSSKPTIYLNHRSTYTDIQDPNYYYPRLNSQTISPISPQTISTNRVPLNKGKPYVVTTPKSSQNTKNYYSSTTEGFKYSPTVPPYTTTNKPVAYTTKIPKIIVEMEKSSEEFATVAPIDQHVRKGTPEELVLKSGTQNGIDGDNYARKDPSNKKDSDHVLVVSPETQTVGKVQNVTDGDKYQQKVILSNKNPEILIKVQNGTYGDKYQGNRPSNPSQFDSKQVVLGESINTNPIGQHIDQKNISISNGLDQPISPQNMTIFDQHDRKTPNISDDQNPGDNFKSNQHAVSNNLSSTQAPHYCSLDFESDHTNHTHDLPPPPRSNSSNADGLGRKSSAIPDHQIVIGRQKISFDDVFSTKATSAPNVIKISLTNNKPVVISNVSSRLNSNKSGINLIGESSKRKEGGDGFYVTKHDTVTPSGNTYVTSSANTHVTSSGNTYVTPSTNTYVTPSTNTYVTPSTNTYVTSSNTYVTPSANTYFPKISTSVTEKAFKKVYGDNSVAFDKNDILSTVHPGGTSQNHDALNTNELSTDNFEKVSTVSSFSHSSVFSNTNTYLPKVTTPPTPTNLQKSNQKTSAGVAQPLFNLNELVLKPKPFELPPKQIEERKLKVTDAPDPTVNYEVSSARPFGFGDATLSPTFPTPYTTDSTYDHLNNMINTLKIVLENKTDTSRAGLVIPPSAGPQTLHTLAIYFANALDGIAAGDDKQPMDETHAINDLLTKSTLNGYHELFKNDDDLETTTLSLNDDFNDLDGQYSGNPTATPRVRQLAQVFTKALSSYLDDPDTFRKVLEEVRPTEPPISSTDSDDDELLNYSDADIKSELPRLTTTPSVHPTWGYILALNNSDGFEHNSLGQEGENLQSADSQSFVSQFNDLVKKKYTTSKPELPDDHWTNYSHVEKLWKNTIYTDPSNINENLHTEPIESEESSEINYEIRALPKLALNSTQVHGILIDFMKANESNKLQRILNKLNTTQAEFLAKMKEIEQNPLTRRLILLLISECGTNIADVESKGSVTQTLGKEKNGEAAKTASPFHTYVDPALSDDNEDTRALQLLNSLYTIASRYGK